MPETYLQQLQKAHKARLKRIAKSSIEKVVFKPEPAPATSPAKPLPENPEEDVLNRGRVTFQDIFKTVCRYYHVSMLDVISGRRSLKIALARHLIAYIAFQHTTLSPPQIALRLCRDRSTIGHAIERITKLSRVEKIAADIAAIKQRLGL